MGWCSGTGVFDAFCKSILVEGEVDKVTALKIFIEELENSDWDCQSDSIYWDHPLVREVFQELHPDWDWNEEWNENLEDIS